MILIVADKFESMSKLEQFFFLRGMNSLFDSPKIFIVNFKFRYHLKVLYFFIKMQNSCELNSNMYYDGKVLPSAERERERDEDKDCDFRI